MFFAVYSCESKKGSWTPGDKEKAKNLIENALKSEGFNLDELQSEIDCSVHRLELHYANFEEVEFDEQGAVEIVTNCMMKDIEKN